MAYDLHIVRTKNWLQASRAPITKSDVDALIARDPELGWSETDYVDMSDDTGAVYALLDDHVAWPAVLLVVSRPDSVFRP